MSMLKKLAANLKGLDLGDRLLRRHPLFYPRALAVYERMETASLDERKAFAMGRLKVVLRKAGGPENIEEWPFLQKEAVRDHPEKFIRGATWKTSQAGTGGTTGVPLKVWRSVESTAFEQAAIDRLIRQAGVEPTTARIAVLRGDNVKDPSDTAPPFWKFTHKGRRMVMSTNHLNAATVAHYRDALAHHKPDLFQVYPTSLESLCRLLAQEGLALSLPFALTSSEALPSEHRLLATTTLGCRLTDYYGQAERVNFACSEEAENYFFSAGYAYNELIPLQDNEYEIVGTAFWNLAMPLVRYRTGDRVAFAKTPTASELEEVCFGLRPFPGILGRLGDYLVTPDGGHLMGIDHFPRDVDNVARMQVIQERRDFVRVLYIPAPGFTPANLAQIQANVALKLPPSMQVSYEEAASLERTPQQKTPFVIKRHGVE